MPVKLSHIGEFGLIDRIRKTVPSNRGVVKGIGDDAAVLEYNSREYLLFTTDMLAEGVHFTRAMGARAIGHKAMACNLSDIAAMGGVPTYAVVSISLPPQLNVQFVQDIYAGLNALARKFKVSVVGGDTVKSDKIVINVALLGKVQKDHLVLRSGARAGDIIFTTGRLGCSLKTGRHLTFTPRVKQSQYLVNHFHPTAMQDVSDGLAADLGHILRASNKGAVLYADQIPLGAGAALQNALYDGEDFELLFTVPPKEARRLCQMKSNRFRFYPIGQIVAKSSGLKLVNRQGQYLAVSQKGFTHF